MNTPSLFTQVTSVYDDKLKWTLDEALGGGVTNKYSLFSRVC